MINRLLNVLVILVLAVAGLTAAQDHHRKHGAVESEPVVRPRVFLDKSPRIVWYQLNRLSNEQLLLVERATDHLKYKPVYTAILIRDGMSPQHREESIQALVKLNKSDAVGELLTALNQIDEQDSTQSRVARQLAKMIVSQPAENLNQKVDALTAATNSDKDILRRTGFAALISAGKSNAAWDLAKRKTSATLDYLGAVPLISKADIRNGLNERIVGLLAKSNPAEVRRAAINAIGFIPAHFKDNFRRIAPFVSDKMFERVAVRTALRIPKQHRDAQLAGELTGVLVKQAEATPPAKRTTDEFIDAMQLADELLALLPIEESRRLGGRLREVVVRVVRMNTVHEEMRYERSYFAVEAGRPVQLVLRNEDLMPHNLVITVPGAMREVALQAAELPPVIDKQGRQYVPSSKQVLFATKTVSPNRQDVLTFTAPKKPGEYPYVCTFPNHWMRMYGVMVVVEDLAAWQADPKKPADPLGLTREFVRKWTLDDLKDKLAVSLRGRNVAIGKKIFTEASCLQCHKIKGEGGAVGPELTDVLKRWKGDHLGVLREILDPSHKVDPKYTLYNVITTDGQVMSGIVTKQDGQSITIVSNPEKPAPKEIARNNIDEMIKTSTSLMPKGLMDRFTEDEIFELLHYLTDESQAPVPSRGVGL